MDREKVINDLLEIRKDYEDMRCKVSVQIIDDAIAMLKEDQKLLDLQHSALRGSSDMVELLFNKLDDQPQIVRCKDCKHYKPNRLFECSLHGACQPNPDWFCADGEKRNDSD